METKMITIPFEVEKAKRIQSGIEEGKIVSDGGYEARIICWDKKDSDYPLVALVMRDGKESVYNYTNKGCVNFGGISSLLDLVLLVPETSLYKEGDILKTFNSFFIFKELSGAKCKCYAAYKNGDIYFPTLKDSSDNYWATQLNIIGYASEEDKQKFIKALKKHNDLTSFKCLKNFFGIQYCFEPFQKVLVRFRDGDTWEASLFSHLRNSNKNEPFCTVGGINYAQCIPYNEETKHLLGTDNDLEF